MGSGMSKSNAMWNQKRRGLNITRLMARDGSNCTICGEPLDRAEPTRGNGKAISFDHIVPRSEGGSDRLENLRLAHRLCNSLRGRDPVQETEA